jgi:hypothetical protein
MSTSSALILVAEPPVSLGREDSCYSSSVGVNEETVPLARNADNGVNGQL